MQTGEEILQERTILAGLHCDLFTKEENATEETLDELEALLETAGGICVGRVLQNRHAPDSHSFLGEGKAEEVRLLAEAQDAQMLIMDNPLTPSQIRALEELTGLTVLDRSALILDIFAQRAKTREGRLQVELAQYKYLLPRLSGMGKSMSRLGGGIGTRGPGETKLETDRRHIRSRITRLQEEMEEVRRIREVQRKARIHNEIPVIALVGYTNAGKSTIMNRLTDAGIPANNRLFDTLDTTTRKFALSDRFDALLSDTVGFIAKLPHDLIEAFKATLEELRYADLLLHVIDASDPEMAAHAAVADKLISELAGNDIPVIRCYNKADLVPPEDIPAGENAAAISAKNGDGIEHLRQLMEAALSQKRHVVTLLLPYSKGAVVDMLHSQAKVLSCEYLPEGIAMKVDCDDACYGRIRQYETEAV